MLHRMPKYGLLLVLLLVKTLAMEDPEPIFKAVGEILEMGFCFGVDYIAVYKINEGEKFLLWNSSDSFSTPDDYKNRVYTSNGQHELLGFQLMDLKLSDSGVYLRECWVDGNRTNQHINYLYMCDKEIPSQELSIQNRSAVLECNILYSEHDNISIKWFREVYPGYKTTLFLDTEKSLEVTEEELKTVLQVQDNGFSVYISASGLDHNQNFFCLVMKRGQCKYFKNIQLPETNKPEMQSVYYAVGEEAVLSCTSEYLSEQTQQKHWKTPFGEVNATTPLNEMFISNSEGHGDAILVIPSIKLNHSGEYACFSQIIVSEYYITVCSELVSNKVQLSSGERVIMACTLSKDESVNILWYRQRYPTESQLIYDSEDPSINIPVDLMDRTHIDSNASLIINDVNENDSGIYWCVELLDTVEGDINESEMEIGNADEESIMYDSEWADEDDSTEICITKRVTELKIHFKDLTLSNQDHSQNSTTEPESSPVTFAVIGCVLAIVILGLIILCVVKMRARRSAFDTRRAETRDQKRNPAVSAPLMSL